MRKVQICAPNELKYKSCTPNIRALLDELNTQYQIASATTTLCSIWILNQKVGLHWKTQQKL